MMQKFSWSSSKKGFGITLQDKRRIHFKRDDWFHANIQTDEVINSSSTFYFEVKIVKRIEAKISIGLVPSDALTNTEVGVIQDSIGFESHNGAICHSSKESEKVGSFFSRLVTLVASNAL